MSMSCGQETPSSLHRPLEDEPVSDPAKENEPLAFIPVSDYRQTLKMRFDELSSYLSSYLTRSCLVPGTFAMHQRITNATPQQLYELSTDICDELSRRRTNEDPCLTPRCDFHPRRNSARQKLAAIPQPRFDHLSGDVYMELARRYPEFYDCMNEDMDWSLALSSWILRQQGYQGLKRARFPNKVRPTSTDPRASRDATVIEEVKDGMESLRNGRLEQKETEKEDRPPTYTETPSSLPTSPRMTIGSELTLVTSPRLVKTNTIHDKLPYRFSGLRRRCKAWFSSVCRDTSLQKERTPRQASAESSPNTVVTTLAKQENKRLPLHRLGYTLKALICLPHIRLGS